MSKPDAGPTLPKSMRHKKILDIAAERPDASTVEIATEVPSATADLVEHVLDEYGDPADDDQPTATESDMNSSSSVPSQDDLTAKQLETLRAIAEYPDAPQRELAETLGISAATVSNRVNAIDGFDWSDRAAFARAVLDVAEMESSNASTAETAPTVEGDTPAASTAEDETDTTEESMADETAMESTTDEPSADEPAETDPMASDSPTSDLTQTVERLDDRLTAVETHLDSLASAEDSDSILDDPELAHKVVHACMDAETISEDEELRILKALLD